MLTTQMYIVVRDGASSGRPLLIEIPTLKLVKNFLRKDDKSNRFWYDEYLLFARMSDGSYRSRSLDWKSILGDDL
jgi:hypothetical protein